MHAKRRTGLDSIEVMETPDTEALHRCCEEMMERWYLVLKGLGTTDAASKEAFYGFHASDVVEIHSWKAGFGASVYYRLRDGRVIDSAARSHEPNRMLYDQTIH